MRLFSTRLRFSASLFIRVWLPGTIQNTLSSYSGTFHCT